MKTLLAALIAVLLPSARSDAAVADHLKCYKITDPQARATYTADLGGLVAEPGCAIKIPAKLLCIETTKTNVNPPTITSPPANPPGDFLCYKVKCPKAGPFMVPFTDQFGARTVKSGPARLLCAPRIVGSPTTTVTTSTTSTTSTTPPTNTGYMDPCSVRCDFVLCITEGAGGTQIGRCTNPCDATGYRISTPAPSRSVFEAQGAQALLDCEPVGAPCFPCQSDTDCDDGNTSTRDVCVPTGGPQASCRHLCPQ